MIFEIEMHFRIWLSKSERNFIILIWFEEGDRDFNKQNIFFIIIINLCAEIFRSSEHLKQNKFVDIHHQENRNKQEIT